MAADPHLNQDPFLVDQGALRHLVEDFSVELPDLLFLKDSEAGKLPQLNLASGLRLLSEVLLHLGAHLLSDQRRRLCLEVLPLSE